jgi:oxygen-independent coproporphyrinogen-3 oxidase
MWCTTVEGQGHGLVEDELLTREEQSDEFLLMGLRLREGIDPERFEQIAGKPLDWQRVQSLREDGMIESGDDRRLRVSALRPL